MKRTPGSPSVKAKMIRVLGTSGASASASRNCPLVRRSTGGGAILHHLELTYSLTIPSAPSAAAARRLYEVVHQSLVALLAGLGLKAALYSELAACSRAERPEREPFLCFERRSCFDVIAAGAKIAGSAQRRRGKAVLQHGSILLARSPFAPQLPGVSELTGVTIAPAELFASVVIELGRETGWTLTKDDYSRAERRRCEALLAEKYRSAAWNEKR